MPCAVIMQNVAYVSLHEFLWDLKGQVLEWASSMRISERVKQHAFREAQAGALEDGFLNLCKAHHGVHDEQDQDEGEEARGLGREAHRVVGDAGPQDGGHQAVYRHEDTKWSEAFRVVWCEHRIISDVGTAETGHAYNRSLTGQPQDGGGEDVCPGRVHQIIALCSGTIQLSDQVSAMTAAE